jgi:pimeloyl-ACP methyl ester carboxylesterase
MQFALRHPDRTAALVLLVPAAYVPRPNEAPSVRTPRGTPLLFDTEFFILRRHRRRGVGTEVARRVFDRYPGKWEVTQLTRNVDAQAFWRRVIGEYTGGRYDERPRPDGRGVMQCFDNGRR